MRELWQTGWMQQNVRMACACLLTEYMGLPWVEGARWFHDTLVDADLAINAMMWQNAGKSGLDQWNFTVTPVSKAQDPTGAWQGCCCCCCCCCYCLQNCWRLAWGWRVGVCVSVS
jgi:deoxyribodipyrimidine photolyase